MTKLGFSTLAPQLGFIYHPRHCGSLLKYARVSGVHGRRFGTVNISDGRNSGLVGGARANNVLRNVENEEHEERRKYDGDDGDDGRGKDSFGAVAIPDVSGAETRESLRRMESLGIPAEGGWRDAVVGGSPYQKSTILLQGCVSEEDRYSVEGRSFEDEAECAEGELKEEESASITRIPVPRQTYIAVSKVELVSSLLATFPSPKDTTNILEVFAALESVLHAEHKSVLEELRMDFGLLHSSDESDKSSTLKGHSKDEVGGNFQKKRPWNWLRRFARERKASPQKLSKVVIGEQLNEAANKGMDIPTEEIPIETQREKAATRFQRHFMRLLRNAQFEGLSGSDLKLTAVLNSDYLLTLPIEVDWNSAASAEALLFRRGYATERQEGLLFGAKLDYLQSVLFNKISSSLAGPLFQAGRWCIEKWESLEGDKEGRELTNRIERWLEEPLHPTVNQPVNETLLESNYDQEGLEIWKVARQSVPRYEAVLSSAGSRGLLIRRILVRMGILAPESPRIPEALHHVDPSTPLEPYMRPKMLERVSLRDIWQPASKAACGNSPWKQFCTAVMIFFSQSTLQEPAFQELVLLYNQGGSKQKNKNGFRLHTYTKIPLPDLKVVFPNKKLSFRLIDTLRLDLATLAGLFAFFVSHKFDDFLSSPSAFALDLIASVSLVLYVTRVALGYKQTADRYQLLVNKTLYEKTLASGFGVIHFLLDASEEQQFKGAILVYALLLGGSSQSMSISNLHKMCERYLYNTFKEQVEMPIQEILAILLRLGLVVEDIAKEGSFISAIPADEKAIAALKQRWLALMSKQSIWSGR